MGGILNISVAMTTYNGGNFITEQINSILHQLGKLDELVICDDGSNDNTIKIIKEYADNDSRIRIFLNNHKGVVKNFEDAILRCNNEIIILSDQDDIWVEDKVKTIKNAFQNSDKLLILHNGVNFLDPKIENKNLLIINMEHGVVKNIIRSCYWGCCMAFRKELVESILPFPKGLIAHDQWIGLIAEDKNESQFINQILVKHRVHNSNVSKKLSIHKKIYFRVNIIKRYMAYKLKIYKSEK